MKRLLYRIWTLTLRLFPKIALNYRIQRFIKSSMDVMDYNEIVFRDDLEEQYKVFVNDHFSVRSFKI